MTARNPPVEVTVWNGGIGMPCTVVLGKRTSKVLVMGSIPITAKSHPEQYTKALIAAREQLPKEI